MPADHLILIHGRPFEAADERALGHGPLAALVTLASEHPELVHRPSAPGGGGWWIGREFRTVAPLTLPLHVIWGEDNLSAHMSAAHLEEADRFCEALPPIIRDHPLLGSFGTYLIRKG